MIVVSEITGIFTELSTAGAPCRISVDSLRAGVIATATFGAVAYRLGCSCYGRVNANAVEPAEGAPGVAASCPVAEGALPGVDVGEPNNPYVNVFPIGVGEQGQGDLIERDLGFSGLETILDRPAGTSDTGEILVSGADRAPQR